MAYFAPLMSSSPLLVVDEIRETQPSLGPLFTMNPVNRSIPHRLLMTNVLLLDETRVLYCACGSMVLSPRPNAMSAKPVAASAMVKMIPYFFMCDSLLFTATD